VRNDHSFLRIRRSVQAIALAVASFIVVSTLPAQFAPPRDATDDSVTAERDVTAKKPAAPAFPDPPGARRLSPRYPVWVDLKEKAVVVDGQISLTKGMLEMFACTRNTKEHESIVSADTKAFLVHTGLLSVGAEAGHPARFQPKYEPPRGTEIEIVVQWKDEQGKFRTARAQDWIRDIRTQKSMAYPFVFGGSMFWQDPETGKQHYQAEGGDFICVSNFGTAMIDIPIKSSQSNEELGFEVFSERVPPLGAPVRMVLKPKLKERGATQRVPGGERGGKKAEGGVRKMEGTKQKAETKGAKTDGEVK
jgi:hypothetical protein